MSRKKVSFTDLVFGLKNCAKGHCSMCHYPKGEKTKCYQMKIDAVEKLEQMDTEIEALFRLLIEKDNAIDALNKSVDTYRGICEAYTGVPKEETCETCTYNPPSSCDGKPCTQCDTENVFLNCYAPKEETE